MRITLEVPKSLELYQDALEGLTRINERMYRQARLEGKPLPSILDAAARVRYVGEYGQEDWKHVGRLLKELEGDCEDLSAARAGELRARGVAGARAVIRRITPTMTHAFVALPGDRYEDPSRRLGMGPPGRPWRWRGKKIP